MKPSWILGLVFVGAVIVLMLMMRSKTQDLASDATSPDARRAADGRALDEWSSSGAARSDRPGGAAPKPGGSDDGRQNAGEHARNPLPGSSSAQGGSAAQRRAQGVGQSGSSLRGSPGEGTGIARSNAAEDMRKPNSGQYQPPSKDPNAAPAEGDPDDEHNTDDSDVAYDSGAGKVFDTASQVEIKDAGPINGGAGTISFWVDPQWAAHSPEDATFVQLGNGDLQIVKDGDLLRFQFLDRNGMQNEGVVDIGEWQSGDSRNVIASWQGGMFTLFVDGAQAFMNYAPSPPAFVNGTNLFVGSSYPDGTPAAAANLSDLLVLNRNLSNEEIQHMYEAGGRAPAQ